VSQRYKSFHYSTVEFERIERSETGGLLYPDDIALTVAPGRRLKAYPRLTSLQPPAVRYHNLCRQRNLQPDQRIVDCLVFSRNEMLNISGLKHIDLSTVLPIVNSNFLVKLTLAKNNIGDEQMNFLCKELARFSALQELDLSHNCFSSFYGKRLLEVCKHLTHLVRLNVSHNRGLDDSCAQSLADLLVTSRLLCLDISYCQFTKKTTMTLWRQQNVFGIQKREHKGENYEGLIELSIGGNKFPSVDVAKELIEALFQSSVQYSATTIQRLSPLEKLSLSNFGFPIDSTPECPLHKLFLSAPYIHLTHLNLSNNNIENINLLAQFITDCKTLVEVNLSKCSLDQHKIRQLFSQLQFSTTLRAVRLKRNIFGDDGADYIAQILQQQKASMSANSQQTGIKELDVSECGLTMRGLLVLLQANTHLNTLCLRGNDLGNRTNLQTFIDGFLKLNKQLTYVDLSDMELTPKDKRLLFQCWQQLHQNKPTNKKCKEDSAIFFCE